MSKLNHITIADDYGTTDFRLVNLVEKIIAANQNHKPFSENWIGVDWVHEHEGTLTVGYTSSTSRTARFIVARMWLEFGEPCSEHYFPYGSETDSHFVMDGPVDESPHATVPRPKKPDDSTMETLIRLNSLFDKQVAGSEKLKQRIADLESRLKGAEEWAGLSEAEKVAVAKL